MSISAMYVNIVLIIRRSMVAKRTPDCEVYPKWSEARFWSFIRSALRKAYSRWPPKFDALKDARRDFAGKGRQKYEFLCAECNNWFPQKSVQVDHKIPAGSLREWEDLVPFTKRLFCSKDDLQILCSDCHKIKTAEERKAAKEKTK